MAEFTDYFENALVDHITSRVEYNVPALYCALFTAAPGETGGGTEVTGGSYARQTGITWGAPAGGITSNTSQVNFPNMPSVTLTHFGFFDALTLGNLLMYSALDASVTVTAGLTYSFLIGDIDLAVQ